VADLNWTIEAQQWLEDIFEYIAQENPVAARQVVTGIYERAQVLIDFPESGYRYHESSRDVRILLYGHYRIAYLVRDDGDVDVLGVFHGSLDIQRYNL
jgi:plasmid stabilization system protein ParE